jgi:hypothetical protein
VTNKTLDDLHEQHGRLGQQLQDLQDKKERSERLVDGTPIMIGAKTFISQGRLELTPQEKLELEAEILYTRIAILKLAEKIHNIRYSGNVPEWIPILIHSLQGQTQQLFIST